MNDPALSIGIYPENGDYLAGSAEIGAPEPTITTYQLRVQHMTKGMDREHVQALALTNSKMVRVLLYRTATLQVKLASLSEDLLGSHERFQRLRVGRQELNEAKIQRSFYFLTVTHVVIETETVKL
jgi:predicted  nucleic acid-binding Zn-ribbon protein